MLCLPGEIRSLTSGKKEMFSGYLSFNIIRSCHNDSKSNYLYSNEGDYCKRLQEDTCYYCNMNVDTANFCRSATIPIRCTKQECQRSRFSSAQWTPVCPQTSTDKPALWLIPKSIQNSTRQKRRLCKYTVILWQAAARSMVVEYTQIWIRKLYHKRFGGSQSNYRSIQ